MTRNEIAYWAKRLELSPDKLAALLKKAFCDVPPGRELDTDLFASRH
jgi:predicted Zn-dependent protease with MMP-like domain